MSSETWRVVLASGEVRTAAVRAFEYECRHICWTANRHATGESKGAAVGAWARNLGLDVREILAPGEPTRAELVAAHLAAREGHAAAEECLAGIVAAWERASADERRMADTFVSGLRREIEEARDGKL